MDKRKDKMQTKMGIISLYNSAVLKTSGDLKAIFEN